MGSGRGEALHWAPPWERWHLRAQSSAPKAPSGPRAFPHFPSPALLPPTAPQRPAEPQHARPALLCTPFLPPQRHPHYLLSQARMVRPRLRRKTIVCPCSGSSASGAGGNVWPRATRPSARARRRPVTCMTCRWWVSHGWRRWGGVVRRILTYQGAGLPLSPTGSGTQLAGMQEPPPPPPHPPTPPASKGMGESEAGARELTPTLYPEALTCRPRLVSVDFMRMKKERSWTPEEGVTSVGLASGAESEGKFTRGSGGGEAHTDALPCPLQSLPDRGSWPQTLGDPPNGPTSSLTTHTNLPSQQQPARSF